MIKRYEKVQKTLNGKLPEPASEHLGYIWLTNAKQIGGFHLFQTALFHDGVNLEHQLSLDEMLIRISHPDILEHIPAAGLVRLPAHGSLW